MIVQLPIVCTDRMDPLQKQCRQQSAQLWYASFDDRPGKLFDGLEHIRATIVLSEVNDRAKEIATYSTDYNRWYSEARSYLFPTLNFEKIDDFITQGVLPKIGSQMGIHLLERIVQLGTLEWEVTRTKKYAALFHNAPQYWVRSMDYAPYFWNERDGQKVSTQMKSVYLLSELDAAVVVAILNSSIFYWWFIIRSDCRHLNLREIVNFPVGLRNMPLEAKKNLRSLTKSLMSDLQGNSQRKESFYKTTGKVVYDEFSPRLSKPIIDQIDSVLARHYGFSDEELDYIINYDIKYRMGDELFSEEEE